jgi:hypothetical protein
VVNLPGNFLTVVHDYYILHTYSESIFIFIVDKAVLEDDYLDHRTLPLRDISRHAECMERSAVSILNYN